MKKCPKCKEEIADDAKVCKHCGAKIGLTPGAILGIIVLIIIGFGIFGNSQNSTTTTSSTQVDTQNNLTKEPEKQGKVEVKSHSLKTSSYGNRSIVGEVINNGVTDATFVKVTATYYDKDNNVTGTDFTYAGDTASTPLKNSETAPFEIMIIDSKIVIDHYKLDVNWN